MWDKAGKHWKRAWHFFWKDDSVWSWLANVIVAFLVIRFIVYPVLGIILGTSFPIVAVVSESMEHGITPICLQKSNTECVKYSKVEFEMCGQKLSEFQESFDNYWKVCRKWYEEKGITKTQFESFPFHNGFDKGDIILLWRAHAENLEVGDVLVFQGDKVAPVIHRIVGIKKEEGKYYYHTKGDHNSESIIGPLGETKISEERLLGQGVLRIPYLGWVKILFVDAVKPLGWTILR